MLKEYLIQLGVEEPTLRPHLRPVLAAMKESGVVGTATLTATEKRRVNSEFRRNGLDGNGRFRSVGEALSVIASIMRDYDIGLLHGMYDNYAYTQEVGSHTEIIARMLDDRGELLEEVTNSLLAIQWHEFKGRQLTEVVAYLS